jgi:hypothetical protein
LEFSNHFDFSPDALWEMIDRLEGLRRLVFHSHEDRIEADNILWEEICRAGNFFDPEDLQIKLEACGFSCRVSKYGWRYTVDAFLQKE